MIYWRKNSQKDSISLKFPRLLARHVLTDSQQIKTMEQKLLLRGSTLSQWEGNVWYNWPIRCWPMRELCMCDQSEGAKKSLESCQSWSHDWVDGLARKAQLYWSWLIFLIPVSPPILSIVMTNNISPRYYRAQRGLMVWELRPLLLQQLDLNYFTESKIDTFHLFPLKMLIVMFPAL